MSNRYRGVQIAYLDICLHQQGADCPIVPYSWHLEITLLSILPPEQSGRDICGSGGRSHGMDGGDEMIYGRLWFDQS